MKRSKQPKGMRSEKKENRQREPLRTRGKRGMLNVLFGRSTLIALALLLQFVFLFGFLGRMGESFYFIGGSAMISITTALHLMNRPMNPSIRQSWLLLVMILPVFGTVLYLFVEVDIGHRLVRSRLRQISQNTRFYFPKQQRLMRELAIRHPDLHALARYTVSNGGFPVYTHTDVEYLPSGKAKLAAVLQELEKAKRFIFLEYFIIEEGCMWNAILEVLRCKASQGVEVRVMYDGTCAFYRLPYHYPQMLQAMGIQCKVFSPIRPMVSTHYNNRDHRKILIIDGHTAFTGGINLADEYINQKILHGHWKDVSILLRGEAVRSFTLMFLQMWNINGRSEDYDRYLSVYVPPRPHANGYVLPYADSPFDKERVGESIYLDIINRAEHYVHIMTPYLIIDNEMTTALTYAAKRGVDVRLILPHIPDKKSAFSLAHSHYGELISAGVRIYEYSPGFVHAKVFVSDGIKAVVGTINLDYRSLYLHFECAAYLYLTPVIEDIEKDFRTTLKKCQQITMADVHREKGSMRMLSTLLKPFAPLM